MLAVIHIARNQTDEALQALRTAITEDPGYGEQFGPLFRAILEERNLERAKVEMNKLKAQGIDLYPLMQSLVEAYLKTSPETPPSEGETTMIKQENHYWKDMQRFMSEDSASAPMEGGILFTGSSTTRLWDLKKFFPDLPVLNRGFGGSAFSDVILFADEIVGPHNPDTIVLYSGDNDIAHGKSAEQTASDCMAAVDRLRIRAPQSRIIVLGTKPSESRWNLYPVMEHSNALIAEQVKSRENMVFLDLAHLLLGKDGRPLPECFLEDKLHMNEEGYRRWSEALKPLL
ncbi:MAG: hypothetical protein BWY09_01742 [Candidatus Hydrogenedentes bacterium ADurb.Bin179]|nr:MAG: hypothetical protein BWY09_01742 [Candidatus Hydrogenedentes bacterium ADurb.Bin179]